MWHKTPRCTDQLVRKITRERGSGKRRKRSEENEVPLSRPRFALSRSPLSLAILSRIRVSYPFSKLFHTINPDRCPFLPTHFSDWYDELSCVETYDDATSLMYMVMKSSLSSRLEPIIFTLHLTTAAHPASPRSLSGIISVGVYSPILTKTPHLTCLCSSFFFHPSSLL